MTLSKKDLNQRIARRALELQNYDYVLEHRPICTNILILEPNTFEENLIIFQGKDIKLVELKETLEKTEHNLYEMRIGVFYKKKQGSSLLFYVPSDMEYHVLYKYHEEMGHVGIDKKLTAGQKL